MSGSNAEKQEVGTSKKQYGKSERSCGAKRAGRWRMEVTPNEHISEFRSSVELRRGYTSVSKCGPNLTELDINTLTKPFGFIITFTRTDYRRSNSD